MKAKHIIVILVLAAISITSCQQAKPEPDSEHQPESISELMDSLLNRGVCINHYIFCSTDSSYHDTYHFGINFYDNCDKKEKDLKLYLADKTPKLLDSICKKSEDSYRYCTSDSLDYNIIVSKNPYESVTYQQYKSEWNNKPYEGFYLDHTINKKANYSSNGFDPRPIHETLLKFLSEQKKVQKYDVCYEWDEGVPITEHGNGHRYVFWAKGPDSLAASKVTGTLYVISLKGQNVRDSLHTELTKRIEKLLTQRPIRGTQFSSYTWSPQKPYMMQNVSVYNYNKRKSNYRIMIDHFTDDLHVLELDYDAPRAAVPTYWCSDIRTYNDKITYRIPE